MSSIGLRADNGKLYWAILSGTASAPVVDASDVINAPKTYTDANSLSWFREKTISLINTYKSTRGAVRTIEPKARANQSFYCRLRLEGVCLEALISQGLEAKLTLHSTMTADLESRSTKKYVEAGHFRGIDLTLYSDKIADAIMAGASVLDD